MNKDYYFSPSVTLFYPAAFSELYELPDDVISVDESVFNYFSSNNKPAGKELGCDRDGKPCWVSESPPTDEERRLWAERNKQQLTDHAENVIAPLERARRLGIATDEELTRLTAWEMYSVLLSRIDVSNASDIKWPEVPA